MPGFDVEPWELVAAAGFLGEVTDELQTGLARVRADVEALLAGWRGAGASYFAAACEQWQAGAADVLAGLAAMAECLDGTGRRYLAAEVASTASAA